MTIFEKWDYNTRIEEFKNVIKEILKEFGLNNKTRKTKDNDGVFILDKRFPCSVFLDLSSYINFNEYGKEYVRCQIASVFNIDGYDDRMLYLIRNCYDKE